MEEPLWLYMGRAVKFEFLSASLCNAQIVQLQKQSLFHIDVLTTDESIRMRNKAGGLANASWIISTVSMLTTNLFYKGVLTLQIFDLLFAVRGKEIKKELGMHIEKWRLATERKKERHMGEHSNEMAREFYSKFE